MKKLVRKLFFVILIGLLIAMVGVIYFKSLINKPASTDTTKKIVFIDKGEVGASIAKKLQDQGIITNPKIFGYYLRASGQAPLIKAGEHTFSPSMTMPQILDELKKSEVLEAEITIPEGWRISQIAKYLEKQNLVKATDFIEQAKADNYKKDYDFLASASRSSSLEGYLFPDTYRVVAEPTVDSIIRKMLDNFAVRFDESYRAEAKKQGFTIHKFITLASIIEKESGRDADREIIASIFRNRLDQDKPLQSDATITFITERPDTRPTIAETKIDSSYNTYIHNGLPPGPVGNPGLKAIKDTLYPAKTDYLFFISDENGVAHFATTYEGHQANIAKYLEK